MENHSWPPPYTVRQSKRARRVFLQILPKKGLEVVLPKRYQNININDLLNEKRSWIEKTWARVMSLTKVPDLEAPTLPMTLELTALSKSWQIFYHPIQNKPGFVKIISLTENTLQIQGDIENISLCLSTLKKWLVKTAKYYLTTWIQELSTQTELYYSSISIRGQSTLWGSCTREKRINLNYKLLFLPKSFVHHILLHELCHLKHLNHSKSFWHLLKKWDQNAENNNRLLKTAEKYLPSWL